MYPRYDCFSFGRHPPITSTVRSPCRRQATHHLKLKESHSITDCSQGALVWHNQIPHPENTQRFTESTQHCLKGGAKSTYLSQCCLQSVRIAALPLGEMKRNSPFLLTSGLTKILRDIKNKEICRNILVLHKILNLCKPFFKKNEDSLEKALECVFFNIHTLMLSYIFMKTHNQRTRLQTHQKERNKHPAPICKEGNCLGSQYISWTLLQFSHIGNILETEVQYFHSHAECSVFPFGAEMRVLAMF